LADGRLHQTLNRGRP